MFSPNSNFPPFFPGQIGGDNMFEMMYEANFTYDSSMPIYENNPPPFPFTFDYKIAHDCMIPPCPEKSYPGNVSSAFDYFVLCLVSPVFWASIFPTALFHRAGNTRML